MLDMKFIDDTVKKMSKNLPPELKKFKTDLEKNFHATLRSTFEKLNLVTREEFDVQKNVLKKSRAKVNSLEKRLEELEQHLLKKKRKKSDK